MHPLIVNEEVDVDCKGLKAVLRRCNEFCTMTAAQIKGGIRLKVMIQFL